MRLVRPNLPGVPRGAGLSETDRIKRAYGSLDERAIARWDLRNAGNQHILAERRRLTRQLLHRAGWVPLGDRRVLDVGSGGGAELAWFRELGASESALVGIDLLAERVDAARRAHPQLEFHLGNAEHLPFPNSSFDLVLAYTVFSSILDADMAANVAAEIQRVIRPGGCFLWYDFRYDSPANRNVRGVSEARVRELFPDLSGELIGLTLLPPLARRLGPLTPIAYPALAWVPPLRSHLLGLLRKPA
jgi:ubiquinone/menaquinone biosynthesis C-methylase UbiE